MLKLAIKSPTLLIDQRTCANNLKKMSLKAKKHGLKLIPHFKTAQSKEIGNWAKAFDIQEITVSSIKMAAYFTGDGWTNIHIAFPFNPLEIPTLNSLAKHQSLSVQLVNPLVSKKLAEEITQPIGFFIEIDAGYGRTGVDASDYALIDRILQEAKGSPLLSFKGFYIHAGHSYYRQDIPQIYEETKQALHALKSHYRAQYPTLVTRTGDTPGCSLMDDFGDIDEIGPGNFMFYDLTQVQIGACKKEDIAVALAVPVVDIQAKKQMILVHGGGVHLSKDFLIEPDGTKNFGEVVKLTEQGWDILSPRSYVKSVSQEHGIIHASQELLDAVQVGDLLGILPVHSCMTADCMKKYFTLSGQEIDHAEGKMS